MAVPAVFEPIVNAPTSQKIALGVMLLVMAAAGAYFLLLSPLQARVDALVNQHATLERDVVQHRAMAADVTRTRKELAEVEKRLEAVRQKLPSEKEIPPLYRTLSDAAREAGLAISLFQPREPRTRDYFNEVPIVVTAEGGYHEVGKFLERVAGLPRVVTISELKLAAATQGPRPIRADLTLATYVYRPVGSAPAPKPGDKK